MPGQKMFNTAWVLSISAFACAALSYTATHWTFPPVGYEGMLVLAGLAIWIGILCIGGTIVLSTVILIKRRSLI